jgi:hypothetical protein
MAFRGPAVFLGALLSVASSGAVPIDIAPSTFETARAEDTDGLFDEFFVPQSVFVRRDDTTFDRASFEYPLAALPAGQTVVASTLSLVTASGFADDAFELYGYAGDGVTTFADFTGGTLIASLPRHWQSTGANPSFEVTSFLESLRAASATHAGFYLKLTFEAPGSLPPEPFRGNFQFMQFVFPLGGGLSVTVPEPSTWLLGLVGLGALMARWLRVQLVEAR